MTASHIRLDALDRVPVTRSVGARCALLLGQEHIVCNRPVLDRLHALGLITEAAPAEVQTRYYPVLTQLGREVGREYAARFGRAAERAYLL